MIRTYSELSELLTFEDRFEYLKISGQIGDETFGRDRYLNQILYHTYYWTHILRPQVIARDYGCDLGIRDRKITENEHIIIHHMNPITVEDIQSHSELVYNPDYLICTSLLTHNAIHYGVEGTILEKPAERTRNDTCPWRI